MSTRLFALWMLTLLLIALTVKESKSEEKEIRIYRQSELGIPSVFPSTIIKLDVDRNTLKVYDAGPFGVPAITPKTIIEYPKDADFNIDYDVGIISPETNPSLVWPEQDPE